MFPRAVFRPTMGALAPAEGPGGKRPACDTILAQARNTADRRVMGLLGVGTLGSPDCRLHAAIRAHSVFSDDVTLAGVRPDLDALLKNCQEYQELTEHCLYYPVSDIANRLYALQVPLAASDPSTSPWNTPRARELFEEIERGVDCINERTLTYPIDELARGCSLAVLMAGGTEKVGGIYWALQHFPWQYVMLATDVETCRALVDVARRATPTSA
ncbi:MAG: hypothetical protein FJX74_25000 [Armatimonadetes bacterium]|nr:hypothetical protein [Armatimonadota bacterium]